MVLVCTPLAPEIGIQVNAFGSYTKENCPLSYAQVFCQIKLKYFEKMNEILCQ